MEEQLKLKADKTELKVMEEQHAKDHRELKEMILALTDKLEPVVKFYDNMGFSKKAMMWVLALIGSLIGIIIGIIKIITMIK